MDKFPLLWKERAVGELTAERDGLADQVQQLQGGAVHLLFSPLHAACGGPLVRLGGGRQG